MAKTPQRLGLSGVSKKRESASLALHMVVAVDPGSIPKSWKHANTRQGPAEGCGKVLAPALPYSPTATFRIPPNLSFTPNQGQFTGRGQGRL